MSAPAAPSGRIRCKTRWPRCATTSTSSPSTTPPALPRRQMGRRRVRRRRENRRRNSRDPVAATLKRADGKAPPAVAETVDRTRLWEVRKRRRCSAATSQQGLRRPRRRERDGRCVAGREAGGAGHARRRLADEPQNHHEGRPAPRRANPQGAAQSQAGGIFASVRRRRHVAMEQASLSQTVSSLAFHRGESAATLVLSSRARSALRDIAPSEMHRHARRAVLHASATLPTAIRTSDGRRLPPRTRSPWQSVDRPVLLDARAALSLPDRPGCDDERRARNRSADGGLGAWEREGANFRLERKRVVLRGAAASAPGDARPEQRRDPAKLHSGPHPTDEFCREASRRGVAIGRRPASLGTRRARPSPDACAWHPSALIALLDDRIGPAPNSPIVRWRRVVDVAEARVAVDADRAMGRVHRC